MSVLTKIRDFLAPWRELREQKELVAYLASRNTALQEAFKKNRPEAIWERLYQRETEYLRRAEEMHPEAKRNWWWVIQQYVDMIPAYYRFIDADRYPLYQPLVQYLSRIGAVCSDISLNTWDLPNGQKLYIDLDIKESKDPHRPNKGIYIRIRGVPEDSYYSGRRTGVVRTFSYTTPLDFDRMKIRTKDVLDTLKALQQFWEVDRHG